MLNKIQFNIISLVSPESLDIERRHMAELTWDAMFKSRRAAILADGGGGVIDSVAVWRPAEVDCSVPLLTVVITRVCRKSLPFSERTICGCL